MMVFITNQNNIYNFIYVHKRSCIRGSLVIEKKIYRLIVHAISLISWHKFIYFKIGIKLAQK